MNKIVDGRNGARTHKWEKARGKSMVNRPKSAGGLFGQPLDENSFGTSGEALGVPFGSLAQVRPAVGSSTFTGPKSSEEYS